MINAEFNQKQLADIRRTFEALPLEKGKKRQIFLRALQNIKKETVKTASQQRTPNGIPWAPRKVGKGKMLRRIAKLMNSQAAPEKGRLFYKLKRTGEIADIHQHGGVERYDLKTGRRTRVR